MENKFYVGIDLSTTITGIAIYGNGEFIKSWNVEFLKYSYENMSDNNEIMKQNVESIWVYIEEELSLSDLRFGNYSINFGIELSNWEKEPLQKYSFNPRIAQRFSQYTGMFRSAILNKFSRVDIKTFNANEWFQHLYKILNTDIPFPHLRRAQRKEIARQFVFRKFGLEDLSEDENDAICIAYFLDICRDVETIANQNLNNRRELKKHKKVKAKKVVNVKLKVLTLEKELQRYELIKTQKKLTKPQVAKIERLTLELEEINNGEI